LADLHLVARLDLDVLHDAADVRRDFDRRLVRLELEDRLILLQRIAGLHQQADNIAARDVLHPVSGMTKSATAVLVCLLP
jgi:hypothetical protein